jgi:hypothetical protein
VLSSQLLKAAEEGILTGAPTSVRGPCLNQLFFADDSLLFCRASETDWQRVSEILVCYEQGSGQRLNKEKTSLFFSRNTDQRVREKIIKLAGVPESQRYDTYLGLPALVGKSRIREFQGIKDRVRKRVTDWKTKFLSQAGKEVLIKAVVQAIPSYSMSMFLLPKELCKELNSMMQNFWWGHKENDKKIKWMSWERMGLSTAEGGMGFRDLTSFNKALLAKQCWRFTQSPDSLVGRIIRGKYYHGGSFLQAKVGSHPSFAWRSILASRDLFKEGILWRIGDGKSVAIWKDRWIPRPFTYRIQSPCRVLHDEATVNELFDPDTGGWNRALINEIFVEEEAEIISNLPRSKYMRPDKLTRRASPSGIFTVRSAYHMEMEQKRRESGMGSEQSRNSHLWKALWGLQVPNSTKAFLWRACRNILPTKDNLLRRGVVKEDRCILCENGSETLIHVLWECPTAVDVWGACCKKIQKCSFLGNGFLDIFEQFLFRCSHEEVSLFAILAKKLWARRNAVLHGGEFSHPNLLVQQGEALLLQFKDVAGEGGAGLVETCVGEEKWSPPTVGNFKANWDVSFDTKNKRMGVGIIVRDHKGEVCAAKSEVI